jgi:predicted dehydrogenase
MQKVTPAIQQAESADVVAIASRDLALARAAARSLGIPTAYGSYQQLLEDATIDAVYVPLPNDQHAEWTIRAAQAGKHVLCEKPLAMSSSQAQEMVDACQAAGVRMQEAFMYRQHATWERAVMLVRQGAIGTLQGMQTWFSYFNDDPQNIRNRTENGGGALMDIGCYPINASRMVFGSEPVAVRAAVRRDPVLDVDVLTSAILEFPGGGQSTFTVSTRCQPHQRVDLVGTEGRIEIPIPFNIPWDRETVISLTTGGEGTVDPSTQVITFAPSNQYTIQAEAFSRAVLTNTDVPVLPSDAVETMRVLERVVEAAA